MNPMQWYNNLGVWLLVAAGFAYVAIAAFVLVHFVLKFW
jgi:hypothetical protein